MLNDLIAGDGKANQLADKLSEGVIHAVQYPKASAIARVVYRKVHRAALVRDWSDSHGRIGALEPLALLGSHLKGFPYDTRDRSCSWGGCRSCVLAHTCVPHYSPG